MDLFDIHFNNADRGRFAGVGVGEIRIGDFRERFESDLSSWDESAYERQWEGAALQVIAFQRAAFITTYAPLSTANFVRCWGVYREGDRLFVREQMLFLEELDAPFDPSASGQYLRDRQTFSADGQLISEWTTSVAAMNSFILGHRSREAR